MTVSSDKFVSDVDAWIAAVPERVNAVFRQATLNLAKKMQERIPRDTGFARASILASLSEMPQIDPESRGVRRKKGETGLLYDWEGGDLATTIAQATAKDTIYIGYTASYVAYLEYGRSDQAPSGFVGITVQEWPAIVQEVKAELQDRLNE